MSLVPPTRIGLLAAAILGQTSLATAQEPSLTATIWPSLGTSVANVPERRNCLFLRAGDSTDATAGKCAVEGHLAARPSFGLAFSGGGNRSATAEIGELRALEALGLLDQVQYVAAVSGGSWTAVPWTFLPESISDKEFLGRYTPPEQISKETLTGKAVEATSAEVDLDEVTSSDLMANAIANSRLAEPFVKAALRGIRESPRDPERDERFARALDSDFLSPFHLSGAEDLFTLDEASAAAIRTRNGWDAGRTIRTVRKDRPFLIALGALSPKHGFNKAAWVPFEMTPLYVGSPSLRGWDDAKDAWGGGYVESFAYDTDLGERLPDGGHPEARASWARGGNPFSLSDVMGTSGAAPADLVDRFGLAGALLGFPRFEHWPVKAEGAPTVSYTFYHGDGGFVDNLGVTSLLRRKVGTILAFINTVRPLCAEGPARAPGDEGRPVKCTAPAPTKINNDLRQLFTGTEEVTDRIVFDNGEAALRDLISGLTDDVAHGRPALECRDHQVIPNEYFAIAEPYKAHICWFYLEWAQKWADKLQRSDGTVSSLKDRQDLFVRFPHYETFFENASVRDLDAIKQSSDSPLRKFVALLRLIAETSSLQGRVIQLYPAQVHALADFTTWSVCEAAAGGRISLPAPVATPRVACPARGG